jgi:hypothetical protein
LRVLRAKNNPFASSLKNHLEAAETALSPTLKLKIIHEKQAELHREEVAIYQAEIARLQIDLAAEAIVSQERAIGLSTYQRIAEAGGLVLTDKDDLYSAYRGRV